MEIFGIDINYIKTISDTYTLIVGFVAIGIPLALQIAGRESEKFDNPILTKRLTSGLIVNPVSLISISILYVIFSYSIKLASSNSSKLISSYSVELNVFSLTLFLITITWAGWFYSRFYLRVTSKMENFACYLLQIKQPLSIKIAKSLHSKYPIKLMETYIEFRSSKKFAKRDIGNVDAGLEILVQQIKLKKWTPEYQNILFEFTRKLTNAYFGAYKANKPKLTVNDIIIIKLYWVALIKIIKISRNNYDSGMSFHSQRLLYSLAGNLIHHPQYDEIVIDEPSYQGEHKICWSSDFYEIARWQSQQPTKGIDLILECEWIKELCGILSEPSFENSSKGAIQAFRLLIDILHLVTDKHPDKIFKLYKNISENLPSFNGSHRQTYWFDSERKWTQKFWFNFYSQNFEITDFGKIQTELDSLSNGNAYIQYGTFKQSKPLSEHEIEECLAQPEWGELFKKAYLSYSDFIALKFLAVLAFHKRWVELYNCLEWSKPKGSNAHYCGNVFLPEDNTSLAKIIFEKLNWITNDFWFIDRQNIEPYVFEGLAYCFLYLNERYKNPAPIYTGGPLTEIYKQESILSRLIAATESLKGNNTFNDSLINNNLEWLGVSLDRIQERKATLKANLQPTIEQKLNFKDAIVEGWEKKLKNKHNGYNIQSLFKVSYSNNVQANNISIIKQDFPKDSFSDSNLEIFGEVAFDRVFNHLYQKLLRLSTHIKSSEKISFQNQVVFANAKTLTDLGFSYKKHKRLNWVHNEKASWVGCLIANDKTLIIDSSAIEVVFTKNVAYLGKSNPLFSYFMNKSESVLELRVDAYFDVITSNTQACFLV